MGHIPCARDLCHGVGLEKIRRYGLMAIRPAFHRCFIGGGTELMADHITQRPTFHTQDDKQFDERIEAVAHARKLEFKYRLGQDYEGDHEFAEMVSADWHSLVKLWKDVCEEVK